MYFVSNFLTFRRNCVNCEHQVDLYLGALRSKLTETNFTVFALTPTTFQNFTGNITRAFTNLERLVKAASQISKDQRKVLQKIYSRYRIRRIKSLLKKFITYVTKLAESALNSSFRQYAFIFQSKLQLLHDGI